MSLALGIRSQRLPLLNETASRGTTLASQQSVPDDYPTYLSLAVICVVGWLVPVVGICIAEFQTSLQISPFWKTKGRLPLGSHAVRRAALWAIVSASLVYIATATGVALFTRTIDSRAVAILDGLSRLLSALIIFSVSYKVPKWLGVYYSVRTSWGEPVGKTEKHLTSNVRWAIWRLFGQMYFITMPFYCGQDSYKLPVSAVCGLVAGYFVYWFVYMGRTRFKNRKLAIAVAMASFLSLGSAVVFSAGCWYISTVWGTVGWNNEVTLSVVTLVVWLMAALVVHWYMWRRSKHLFDERQKLFDEGKLPSQSLKYKTALFQPRMFKAIQEEEDEANRLAKTEEASRLSKIEESGEISNASEELSNRPKEEAAMEDVPVETIDDADEEDDDAEKEDDVRTWDLICLHCCARGELAGELPPKTKCRAVLCVIKWTLWLGISGLFLYLTIINIGASVQASVVNQQLPASFAYLYPPDYNVGPVCAWNGQGENSDIETFATNDEALAAGYQVVHCGACGACSNWNDLRLQWTTRKNLAAMAQTCARKSLTGSEEAVNQCNMDLIGFTEDCAWCWTDDELCAKSNCVFIFLQGVFINQLGNFAVGEGVITSATCDEAMCGPEFVPCSGATRRRMNIKSDIPRPDYQQCRLIDQDWAVVFDHP